MSGATKKNKKDTTTEIGWRKLTRKEQQLLDRAEKLEGGETQQPISSTSKESEASSDIWIIFAFLLDVH